MKENPIIQKLFGSPEEFPIEHRLFNGAMLFSSILAAFITTSNVILGLDPVLNVLILTGAIFFSSIYYFTRIKQFFIGPVWLVVIFFMCAMPFAWFLNSGLLGSTIYVIFVILILITIITEGKIRIIVIILVTLEIISLIVLEYWMPHLVVPYKSRELQFTDMILTLVFSLVTLYLLVNFIMKNYEDERRKAEESNQLKSYFLANISHEIRTPMNSMLGFANLLKDRSLNETDRNQYIDLINKSGNHLLNLINNVIDFSRIEAGEISIKRDVFSINSLMKEIHTSYKSYIDNELKKSITLHTSFALRDSDSFIETDEMRLRQVLINLLSNAVKFTDSGFIKFGYFMREKRVLLFFIEDSGIGITDKEQSVIFNQFKQADDSTTRQYGGAGLGLSIVKKLVELLGGEIWVKSTSDRGSTFYFNIPYVHRDSDERSKKEQVGFSTQDEKSIINGESRLILIVEDHDESYNFLSKLLVKWGFKVIRAHDGLESIMLCKTNESIDLVLMDIQLPVMSGDQAIRNIRNFRKDLPIIAQTGNVFEEDKKRCIDAGCDEFISKPIDIDILKEKIKKYL